jgi:pimeloyl-ACP methyl ester carboxylesterase
MKYIKTADDTSLYVKVWGKGRPVILIHGWPLSADSWDDQALALADAGYQAIAYDRRGFGRSSQPWTGYDYDTLSDDLAAVIEQTGARDATLVGFSMGGGEVARYLSRHHGKSIIKAALISSIVPFMLKTDDNPDGTPQSTFDGFAADIRKDRAAFFHTFAKQFFGVGVMSHPVSEETIEWARGLCMQAGLKATLGCASAFASTDFRPELSAFTVPTLIIHGTADKTVPIDASGRAAAKGIAGSRLIEYDGAPHGLLATDKERLNQDLLSFLAA